MNCSAYGDTTDVTPANGTSSEVGRERALSALRGVVVIAEMPGGRSIRGVVVDTARSPQGTRLSLVAVPDARGARVCRQGAWFEVDGRHVDLARYPTLRRLLAILVERRDARPAAFSSSLDLAREVWPGERMMAWSAKRRIQSLVYRLRRLGLGPMVLAHNGYALAPDVAPVGERSEEASGTHPTLRIDDAGAPA